MPITGWALRRIKLVPIKYCWPFSFRGVKVGASSLRGASLATLYAFYHNYCLFKLSHFFVDRKILVYCNFLLSVKGTSGTPLNILYIITIITAILQIFSFLCPLKLLVSCNSYSQIKIQSLKFQLLVATVWLQVATWTAVSNVVAPLVLHSFICLSILGITYLLLNSELFFLLIFPLYFWGISGNQLSFWYCYRNREEDGFCMDNNSVILYMKAITLVHISCSLISLCCSCCQGLQAFL